MVFPNQFSKVVKFLKKASIMTLGLFNIQHCDCSTTKILIPISLCLQVRVLDAPVDIDTPNPMILQSAIYDMEMEACIP